MNKKDNKIVGILLIILIIAFVLGFAIWGYSIMKKPKENILASEEDKNTTVLGGESAKSSGKGNALPTVSSNYTTKPKRYMEDYVIIGELQIPKVDLKTNILEETTKRSLEIAVAQIYTVNGLNKPGNTVIYGHNYRNSLFFSRNDELEIGDEIYVTDEEGNRIEYEIYDKFETSSTDTSFYSKTAEETLGKCEITLSTCTDDASTTDRRIIVLAKEKS